MGCEEMVMDSEEYEPDAQPVIVQAEATQSQHRGVKARPAAWRPACRRACHFNPTHFGDAMLNAIRNPNLLSSWLFRADILADHNGVAAAQWKEERQPRLPTIKGMQCERVLTRRLVPRNTKRDSPMVQSCAFYADTGPAEDDGVRKSLVVYIPHVASASEIPFYHPQVEAVGLLHEWDPARARGTFSVHYRLFDAVPMSPRLLRTALNILSILHKLGQGEMRGYVKRVQHDTLVPQAVLQDRFSQLRDKHAKRLVHTWQEVTDPTKHVFEDLGIAAFLIELWAEMYKEEEFPGFVDIGAGNGLLVHLLNAEGFRGWGFDARSRKSWDAYGGELGGGKPLLQQLVLIPSLIQAELGPGMRDAGDSAEANIHSGSFPKGTFIISNHADELTPWTPILATASDCPFIAIPCCSHNLNGAKFRAPLPKDKSKPKSTYACLVSWVSDIASDCGWEVETEMLRIPSTRNTAIVGRRRMASPTQHELRAIIDKYGGAANYRENALSLVKVPASRGH